MCFYVIIFFFMKVTFLTAFFRQFDASQTVTLKKRRASQFGAQTMVQRKPKNVPAKTLPSAEAVAETKVCSNLSFSCLGFSGLDFGFVG